TEVAEMAEAKAVELEAEDRVRPTLRARNLVVLGRDRDELADRGVERPGRRPEGRGRALHYLGSAVVEVLVRDQQDVGLEPLDRRGVEHEAAGGHSLHPPQGVGRGAPRSPHEEGPPPLPTESPPGEVSFRAKA